IGTVFTITLLIGHDRMGYILHKRNNRPYQCTVRVRKITPPKWNGRFDIPEPNVNIHAHFQWANVLVAGGCRQSGSSELLLAEHTSFLVTFDQLSAGFVTSCGGGDVGR